MLNLQAFQGFGEAKLGLARNFHCVHTLYLWSTKCSGIMSIQPQNQRFSKLKQLQMELKTAPDKTKLNVSYIREQKIEGAKQIIAFVAPLNDYSIHFLGHLDNFFKEEQTKSAAERNFDPSKILLLYASNPEAMAELLDESAAKEDTVNLITHSKTLSKLQFDRNLLAKRNKAAYDLTEKHPKIKNVMVAGYTNPQASSKEVIDDYIHFVADNIYQKHNCPGKSFDELYKSLEYLGLKAINAFDQDQSYRDWLEDKGITEEIFKESISTKFDEIIQITESLINRISADNSIVDLLARRKNYNDFKHFHIQDPELQARDARFFVPSIANLATLSFSEIEVVQYLENIKRKMGPQLDSKKIPKIEITLKSKSEAKQILDKLFTESGSEIKSAKSSSLTAIAAVLALMVIGTAAKPIIKKQFEPKAKKQTPVESEPREAQDLAPTTKLNQARKNHQAAKAARSLPKAKPPSARINLEASRKAIEAEIQRVKDARVIVHACDPSLKEVPVVLTFDGKIIVGLSPTKNSNVLIKTKMLNNTDPAKQPALAKAAILKDESFKLPQ